MVSINKITPTRRVQPIKSGNKNNSKTQHDLPFERAELNDKKNNDEVQPIKHIDERI